MALKGGLDKIGSRSLQRDHLTHHAFDIWGTFSFKLRNLRLHRSDPLVMSGFQWLLRSLSIIPLVQLRPQKKDRICVEHISVAFRDVKMVTSSFFHFFFLGHSPFVFLLLTIPFSPIIIRRGSRAVVSSFIYIQSSKLPDYPISPVFSRKPSNLTVSTHRIHRVVTQIRESGEKGSI